jgi:hypothetical protein
LGIALLHADFMKEVEPSPIRKLVAQNVTAVIQADDPSAGKGIKKLMSIGLSRGSAGRLVTPGKNSWNIDLLEQVASQLHLQPWELLLPDLSPAKGGGVRSVQGMKAKQWPFVNVSREDIADLNPTEMERLETTMRSRIQEIRSDRRPEPVSNKRLTKT